MENVTINIHYFYKQLSEEEKKVVDNAYNLFHKEADKIGVNLKGNDMAEAVVESMSMHLVRSK